MLSAEQVGGVGRDLAYLQEVRELYSLVYVFLAYLFLLRSNVQFTER
jgi:hypothetical protein